MKIILSALCALLLFTRPASAQPVTAESFRNELRAIIDDAQTGFPKSTGSQISDSRYGTYYSSKLGLAGGRKSGELYYSKTSLQEFSFGRMFDDTTSAGKFAAANAESILDGLAKEYRWKKVLIKQDEDKRSKYQVKEYRQGSRKMAAITWYLEHGSSDLSLNVFSSYRPKGVVMPNLLGCMVFWFQSDFRYVVPVYGAALGDKAKVAADAYAKSGLVERDYKYEWMEGSSTGEVSAKYGSSFSIKVLNDFKVD